MSRAAIFLVGAMVNVALLVAGETKVPWGTAALAVFCFGVFVYSVVLWIVTEVVKVDREHRG